MCSPFTISATQDERTDRHKLILKSLHNMFNVNSQAGKMNGQKTVLTYNKIGLISLTQNAATGVLDSFTCKTRSSLHAENGWSSHTANSVLVCESFCHLSRPPTTSLAFSRAADLGSIPAFPVGLFLGRVLPVIYPLVLQWLPCQGPGVLEQRRNWLARFSIL